MRTVVLAATKGGVGKTTLTAALAVCAMEDGATVALIDADPQQSLAMWHGARAATEKLQLIGDDSDDVMFRHDGARRSGADYLFIDTPPAMISIIEPCVRLANLVVIPVRPSPLDILAIDPILELCKDHRRPSLFVLNQTAARSAYTDQASKLLKSDGAVYDGEIGSRQNYAIAMVRGQTAPEVEKSDGKSREEIGDLWQAVKRLLASAK
jgi:chromosome partitioning protein